MKTLILACAAGLALTGAALASENTRPVSTLPTLLTDVQMDQVVAGEYAAPKSVTVVSGDGGAFFGDINGGWLEPAIFVDGEWVNQSAPTSAP